MDTSLDNFEKIEKIGKGSFGEVLKIRDKETGEIYAAKIGFKSIEEETKAAKLNLAREVNLLSQLNHPSILKFIGYSPYNFEKKNKPIIITEYSPTGSLFDILELERNGRAPDEWNTTKKLINIYGIANAMSYLHSNNILHRDLKPQNILEDDYLFPKISDFGFSKVYHQNLESMTIQSTIGFKGTPIYIAPEIWKSSLYTKEGDVYAFAFILYEIVTGEQPFNELTSFDFAVEVVQNGRRPDFKYEIPESYRSLIERCWDEDPKNRPTFDQISSELKDNEEYITDGIDKSEFLDYVDFISECKKSFDSGKAILKVEDVLQNKQSSLLRKVVILKKDKKMEKQGKNSLLKKNVKEVEKKPQTFYEEITKSEYFNRMSQDAQKFFKYIIKPDTKEKTITLSRNNLSNLSNLVLSSDFISILKMFDQINVELKYPSHNFAKMFDTVKSIKENDLHQMYVHILVSSREANFILGSNQVLDAVTISPCVGNICESAFSGCEALKEIDIPPSVTRIGEMAFSGCVLLEKVTILSSVAFVGKGAFKGCSNLREITINPLKTTVDFTAFQECPNLHSMILTSDDSVIAPFNEEPFHNITKITIHPSVTIIQENTFKRFTSVKEIIVPSSVSKVEYSAFNGCQSLEKMSLPGSITEMDVCVFYGCTSLKKINLPSSLKIANCFMLFGCTSLSELKLPETVKNIERYSFSNCTSLKNVELPLNLREIGEAAFKGCTSLEEIIMPLFMEIIDHRAFEGCEKLKTINFFEIDEEEEEEEDSEDYKMKCYFGEYVFNNCSSLDNVDFTKHYHMNSVPVGFFKNCSSLSTFDLKGFYTVDENAFRGCSSLTNINFPDTVKIIEENAFRDCKSLVKVVIPQFTSTLGESSFMNCTSLENVSFLATSLTSIDDHVFEGCTSLKEIKLPESVSSIGKFSFSGCTALTSVKIPESVYSIGDCAFLNCASLTNLELPPELKEVGKDCFKGCSSLKMEE